MADTSPAGLATRPMQKEPKTVPLIGVLSQELAYLEEAAPIAYTFCIGLFGEPADAERPFEIHREYSWSGCCYNALLRAYMIEISMRHRTHEQLCSTIGHEMYHRVTMRRMGVHREPWLDEALACLTSLWFLRDQGFSETADQQVHYRLMHTRTLEISSLRAARKSKNPWKLFAGRVYAPEFGDQVQLLGIELQRITGPEKVARIVGAASLADWMSKLTDEQSAQVNALLSSG